MQAWEEAPPSMQCKDKFLLQSVIAPNGATKKDTSPELVVWSAPLFYYDFGSSIAIEVIIVMPI